MIFRIKKNIKLFNRYSKDLIVSPKDIFIKVDLNTSAYFIKIINLFNDVKII